MSNLTSEERETLVHLILKTDVEDYEYIKPFAQAQKNALAGIAMQQKKAAQMLNPPKKNGGLFSGFGNAGRGNNDGF